MTTELKHGQIEFRPTVEDDLEKVILIENDDANTPYIRQWTHREHVAAISDKNIIHFIIQDLISKKIVGYTILIGAKSSDHSLEFKRIAIADKGHGYGRSAAKLIKKYAFEHLKFNRLWLEVIMLNTRAFKLYQSEGFVKEGIHREAIRKDDKYHSFIVMSILKSEYFDMSEKREKS